MDLELNRREKLDVFFTSCDLNRSGFIEEEDLDSLCDQFQLDHESIKEIFAPLDTSGDGKITRDEFIEGFAHVQQLLCPDEELEPASNDRRSPTPSYTGSDSDIRPFTRSRNVRRGRRSVSNSRNVKSLIENRRFGRDSEETFENNSFHVDVAALSSSCHARIADIGSSLKDLPDLGEEDGDNTLQTVVAALVNQLQHIESEVGQLSDSMRKSTLKHSDHINCLQEEMEAQISRAEKTAYNLADEAASSKQRETERRLEAEIRSLKDKLDEYKSLEEKVGREKRSSEQSSQLKRQIEYLSMENLELKNCVLDTQTGIAALRSEMAKMHSKFEEQQKLIAQEKEAARSYQNEVLNLSKQLQTMHESNKRLHDNSDVLSFAMEQNQSAIRMLSRSASPSNSNLSKPSSNVEDQSLRAELAAAYGSRSISNHGTPADVSKPFPSFSSIPNYDFHDESDSGRYSFAGSGFGGSFNQRIPPGCCDADEEDEIFSDSVRPEDSISMVNSNNSNLNAFESNKLELQNDDTTDGMKKSPVENHVSSIEGHQRKRSAMLPLQFMRRETTDYARTENLVPLNDHKQTARCDSNDTLNSEMSQDTVLVKPVETQQSLEDSYDDDGVRTVLKNPALNSLISPQTEHGVSPSSSPGPDVHFIQNEHYVNLRKQLEPKNQHYHHERQYRVVLAGDAAVGKSSFILQLCTGYFHNRITSTLGVDFHTKSFEIDGKLTNLQLWDTAGQERFRAMARSYFRRADGAILLYDVTFEQSFLHVRDWVETIESGANRKIPIIICANKCDAIPECKEKGIPFVPTEQGAALAKSYGATFVEVSAKEGHNVLEAIVELSRQLWIAEDEERSNGLKLTENATEEESKCCK